MKGKLKMKKTNENGRSMVEMLGVLAIIGVLSVAGIVGYTIAMRKHRANEIAEAVSMLAVAAKTGEVTTNTHDTYTHFFGRSNPTGADILKATDNETVELYVTNNDVSLCKEVLNNFGTSSANAIYVETEDCDATQKLIFKTN